MRRYLIFGIPLVLLAALLAWRIASRVTEKPGARPGGGGPVVAVARAERRDIQQIYELVGSVESPQRVAISAKVTGRIDWLTAQAGDRVERGQVLVRLDDADLLSQVNAAEASVAEARYRLAQARLTQNPTETSVRSELRQQEAAVVTARADLEQSRQSARGTVGAAQAAVDNAQASLDNARAREARVESLYQQAFTAAQDLDDARTATQVARGQLRAAQENLRVAQARGRAEVEAAQARYQQAQAALDVARANTVQKAAYGENLAALEAVVRAAEASHAGARSRLKDTVLASPVDGWVTARHLDPGNIAETGTPILTVQASGSMWLTGAVPEEVRPKIELGQAATAELDALAEQRLPAEIVQINAAADPESRQFQIRVRLPEDNRIRPGMYGRVQLPLAEEKGALVVPRTAVLEGDVCMVVGRDDTVTRRPVKLGMLTADYQQILDGLKEGERVVTLSAVPLRDGQKVRIAK